MNKRQLKLENYGISNHRYQELQNFCRQYPEWKDELKHNTDTVKSPNLNGMSRGGKISDQTAELAARRAQLDTKCRIIEQAAAVAGGDLSQYIIKSVCGGEPMWYLRDIMGMPCERDTFYDARRYFFYLLDKKDKYAYPEDMLL